MILQEFLGVLKVILVAAFAAAVISFVTAVSFWWGTYFSIRMLLNMIAEVFC